MKCNILKLLKKKKHLKYVFWNLYPGIRVLLKKYILSPKRLLRRQPFCIIYYSHFHSNTPLSMGYPFIPVKEYRTYYNNILYRSIMDWMISENTAFCLSVVIPRNYICMKDKKKSPTASFVHRIWNASQNSERNISGEKHLLHIITYLAKKKNMYIYIFYDPGHE